jgi:hypothetical protein
MPLNSHDDADDYAGLPPQEQMGTARFKPQPTKGYELIRNLKTGDLSIRCHACGQITFNPDRVGTHYQCSACHRVHKE